MIFLDTNVFYNLLFETRFSLAARRWLGGPQARARVRAQEADRADYEVGARPALLENPDDRKKIDPGKVLYIIMFNSTSGYRLSDDLKAIQIVNEAGRCRKLYPSRMPNAT